MTPTTYYTQLQHSAPPSAIENNTARKHPNLLTTQQALQNTPNNTVLHNPPDTRPANTTKTYASHTITPPF